MKYIKTMCKKCGHIEMKSTMDMVKEIISTGLYIGGTLFWVIVFMVYWKPVFAGKVASVFSSFILNNLAGYQVDDYLRGIAAEQVVGCGGNDHCNVEKLVNYVYNELIYTPDTVAELYRTPREVLESGYSDCSGMAVSFCGLARQVGMPCRVVAEAGREGLAGHAYTVVESVYGTVFVVDPTAGTYEVVG